MTDSRVSALFATGLLMGAGCARPIEGQVAPQAGAKSALVYFSDDAISSVEAFALDESGSFIQEIIIRKGLPTAFVSYFYQDLEALRMAPGKIQNIGNVGARCGAGLLPVPIRSVAVTQGTPQDLDGPPQSLVDFRFKVPQGVVSEPVVHVFDQVDGDISPMVRRNGMILLPVNGGLYLLDPESPRDAPRQIVEQTNAPFWTNQIYGYYQHPNGLEIVGTGYAGSNGGQIWCGNFGSGFTQIAEVRDELPGLITTIVGPESPGEPFDIYAIASGCQSDQVPHTCPRSQDQYGQLIRLSAATATCTVDVEVLSALEEPGALMTGVRSTLFRLTDGGVAATIAKSDDMYVCRGNACDRFEPPGRVQGGGVFAEQLALVSRDVLSVQLDLYDTRDFTARRFKRDLSASLNQQLEDAISSPVGSLLYFGRRGTYREIMLPAGEPIDEGNLPICDELQKAVIGEPVSRLVRGQSGVIMTTSDTLPDDPFLRRVEVMYLPGPPATN